MVNTDDVLLKSPNKDKSSLTSQAKAAEYAIKTWKKDSPRLKICFSPRSGGIPESSVSPDCLYPCLDEIGYQDHRNSLQIKILCWGFLTKNFLPNLNHSRKWKSLKLMFIFPIYFRYGILQMCFSSIEWKDFHGDLPGGVVKHCVQWGHWTTSSLNSGWTSGY